MSKQHLQKKKKKKLQPNKLNNIAIFHMEGTTFSNEVVQGIKHALHASACCTNTLQFHAITQKRSAQEIAQDLATHTDLACIVCIESEAALAMKAAALAQETLTPLIFVGVANPVATGLVASEERPGGTMTGITLANLPRDIAARILLTLSPQVRSVLIPYNKHDNAGVIVDEVAHTTSLLQQAGAKVQAHEVANKEEALASCKDSAASVDAILLLTGSCADAHITTIASTCAENATLLGAYNLLSTEKGAHFSWGSNALPVGKHTASMLCSVICTGQHPSQMPVVTLHDWATLAIDQQACSTLGIELTKHKKQLLSALL